MMFSTVRNTLLASALLGAGTLLSAAACTSEDTDPSQAGGGATGTGGTANRGGNGGTGGGSGGSGGAPAGAVACPTPSAVITDFTYPADAKSTTDVSFGTFATDSFSGGSFVFPAPGQTPTPMYPLKSDVTGGNWHITGSIGSYSGFGLYHACQKIDASAFKGIRFTVSGTVAMGGMLTLNVGTAANDISAVWLNAHKFAATDPDVVGFGRCTPIGTMPSSRYDGTCGSPNKSVPVTATPTPVTVLWADLVGGKPEVTVNRAEITSIGWSFVPPPGVDTAAVVPYDVDIVIDDLEFVE